MNALKIDTFPARVGFHFPFQIHLQFLLIHPLEVVVDLSGIKCVSPWFHPYNTNSAVQVLCPSRQGLPAKI